MFYLVEKASLRTGYEVAAKSPFENSRITGGPTLKDASTRDKKSPQNASFGNKGPAPQ
jgi:hypothetical protein